MASVSSCDNYGVLHGSSCDCPTGFGGANCSQPGCGGNIFEGSGRALAPFSGGAFANLTDCTCESGWTGTGCNVCKTASVCQSAYTSSGHNSSSISSGLTNGQNDTLTCNADSRVYAAGQMSCDVVNPTLQAIYPLSSTLNILRTLNPSLTPLPNVTGFGSASTIYAQLFYDGVEQFYCHASSCTQDTGSAAGGGSTWTCQDLACTCVPNTSFCGAVSLTNLTSVIDSLADQVVISCDAPDANSTAACAFKQATIESVFGSSGLTLSGCVFGECVSQGVIDAVSSNSTRSGSTSGGGKELSGGVIAGLAVVCGLIGIALLLLVFGWFRQRQARKKGLGGAGRRGGIAIDWSNVCYTVPGRTDGWVDWFPSSLRRRNLRQGVTGLDVLHNISGHVAPGEMMAIMGPSGAGKTTLIEILAGKQKSGQVSGMVSFSSTSPDRPASRPRIGFVPQQDILPPTLTVHEALLFAARLRLPEAVPVWEKLARVDSVIGQLGLVHIRDVRIGDGENRGISGGEMRRVSIGLELVARPDILILDEPTSGLDSVSAKKVGEVLRALAHDAENPTVVIASIHQPSSQLFQSFDKIMLLSHGYTLYSGEGGLVPPEYFAAHGFEYAPGYNVADYLLDIASDPPVALLQASPNGSGSKTNSHEKMEKLASSDMLTLGDEAEKGVKKPRWRRLVGQQYAATFLTQLQVLSSREWKILRRDKTLFYAHIAVSCVLGVFCGGLYYKTGITIAGFQSRVGCLFFLGALIAFSSLSALYNIVEIRMLFVRERSASYYSPAAWLLSRFIFDVIPLRVLPTIIISSITYWMVGFSHDAARFFKFLFILVLYTLAMTLWNFLLACLFRNGGIAILLSALTALYQMTYAGFFVHLNSIPPVLRWLQWLCPLKYNLEALSVNEVGSGLMIEDTLDGVPVDVSASLIMETLFGFKENAYYRDVLVLFAFIAGFAVMVVGTVWLKVRERR